VSLFFVTTLNEIQLRRIRKPIYLYRYHLGVALLQNGEKHKARTEFQAALTKKPQQTDEKKIRELLAGIS